MAVRCCRPSWPTACSDQVGMVLVLTALDFFGVFEALRKDLQFTLRRFWMFAGMKKDFDSGFLKPQ